MSKSGPSFTRQTVVLTSRYFRIFVNNKKNLLMALLIPLLTMLIVAIMACSDMYVDKDSKYSEINNGYPVLSWEAKGDDDKEMDTWSGNNSTQPLVMKQTIDDEEYYVISSADDFHSVISYGGLGANYYLNCDLDLNNYNWTPIGTDSSSPFTGKFKGNGHIIYNLSIDGDNSAGLFGYTDGATIENLGIDHADLTGGGTYAGALVGTAKKTTIRECFAKNVTADAQNAGGLVGMLEDNSTIETCYTIASINGNGDIVGDESNSNVSYSYYIIGHNEPVLVEEEYDDRDTIDDASLKETASIIGMDGVGFKIDAPIIDKQATQIGLFMVICVAIFVGVCNSIQEIIKERSILKREYMSGLNLGAYMASKLIVQGLICAGQVLLITVIFYLAVSGKSYPTHGIIFPSCTIDFYITMFLVTFAADVTALFISSIVKTSVMANTFIPIILIVQIIFSGVLFDLEGAGEKLAWLMLSKWGISALSAISFLNEGRPEILLDNPQYEQQLGGEILKIKSAYESSSLNMLLIWFVLIVFIVIFATASIISLKRIKHDKR